MYFQEIIHQLNSFWMDKGCMFYPPYHTEVGAGTSNPATFLRVLGPEPWSVAYMEPCARPADGRYGENPNRLQHYMQYQVILKPSPENVQDLLLQSLESLGLNLQEHDFRFVEDNWESPSLGAWGLGWEVWLDGMEIVQFTYFQECGGQKLSVRACEITYGLERIATYLQNKDSIFDIEWAPGVSYHDIYFQSEVEFCKYNFEHAQVDKLFQIFQTWEEEGLRLLEEGLVMPAYDHCLRLSHVFNVLDARGAFTATERGRFLLRCRAIAERCAKSFAEQREELGYPLLKEKQAESLEHPEAKSEINLSEKADLLIELGCEELPHGDLRRLEKQVPEAVADLLKEYRLDHDEVEIFLSPRRISFLIHDCASKQQDVEKEVKGPAIKAAKDSDGNWAKPALKFVEGHGKTTDDIVVKKAGKVESCFLQLEIKGEELSQVLSSFISDFLQKLRLPKSMGWEDSTFTFSRPIRWLITLHGENHIPTTITLKEEEGQATRFLFSSKESFGHRRKTGSFAIDKASDYLQTLREHKILAKREERKQMLQEKVEAICEKNNLVVSLEEHGDLLAEVADLVEWPDPVVCSIPEEALDLPAEIIITPMKVQQRYFPLQDKDGKFSKYFLAITNGEYDEAAQKIIRHGNERVLNARLRDARHFWDVDTKIPLAEFSEKLARITFHQKLGTMHDKVERMVALYEKLKDRLPEVDGDKLVQVLRLMKADLATQMVFEFTSLEGLVGMLYAKEQKIEESVATALWEHKLPRFAGDDTPSSSLGTVAGLLDRLDTLAGYFAIGVRQRGSSDPFGLRRSTIGIISLSMTQKINLTLMEALEIAIDNYPQEVVENREKSLKDLRKFSKDRLQNILREDKFSHDYIRAAMDIHSEDPYRVYAATSQLHEADEETVQNVAEQVKRIIRIAKSPAEKFDVSLLEDSEKKVHGLLEEQATKIQEAVAQNDFASALATASDWVEPIANYFDEVLVNHKDKSIKGNRHKLLQDVCSTLCLITNFDQIEKK